MGIRLFKPAHRHDDSWEVWGDVFVVREQVKPDWYAQQRKCKECGLVQRRRVNR